MDQRKYLIKLFLVLFNFYTTKNTFASAWLREKGKYFLSFSFDRFDVNKSLITTYSLYAKDLQSKINILYLKRSKAIGSRKVNLIRKIDNQIEKLKKEQKKLPYSYQLFFYSLFFEYGINKYHNLGGKFLLQRSSNYSKKLPSYNIKQFEFFTKHFLYATSNSYFSFQNILYISTISKWEINVLMGKTNNHRLGKTFSTWQLGYGNSFTKEFSGYTTYNFTQGLEFKNGVILLMQSSNTIPIKSKKLAWSKEEISAVKKFFPTKIDYYAIQIGHFWQYQFKPIKRICTGYKISFWFNY